MECRSERLLRQNFQRLVVHSLGDVDGGDVGFVGAAGFQGVDELLCQVDRGKGYMPVRIGVRVTGLVDLSGRRLAVHLDRVGDPHTATVTAPLFLVGQKIDEPPLEGRDVPFFVDGRVDVGDVARDGIHAAALGHQAAGAQVEGIEHGKTDSDSRQNEILNQARSLITACRRLSWAFMSSMATLCMSEFLVISITSFSMLRLLPSWNVRVLGGASTARRSALGKCSVVAVFTVAAVNDQAGLPELSPGRLWLTASARAA